MEKGWVLAALALLVLVPIYAEWSEVTIKNPSGTTVVNAQPMDGGTCDSTWSQNAQTSCSYTYSYNICGTEGDWTITVYTSTRYCSGTGSCPTGYGETNTNYGCDATPDTLVCRIDEFSTITENVNWDTDQKDCECYGKKWVSSASKCCGDDGGSTDTFCDGTGAGCDAGTYYSDPDSSQYVCGTCAGKTWVSGVSKCCGDDGINDDFENAGTGNSCCINGELVASGALDSTSQFMCIDGAIYGCNGLPATGVGTQDASCARRNGYYCDGSGTNANKWKTQIADGGTPDDCDGTSDSYYGTDEASTTYDKESCSSNYVRRDYNNDISNQDQAWICSEGWRGPYIATCSLSQSGSSDDFMTLTVYWEASDEIPDKASIIPTYRWRIDDDGTGTGACDYPTNGCYYDTGVVDKQLSVDANEGTYGDYYSDTIQWSDFATKPTSKTTYYLEIGEEECLTCGIDATEDPNTNEGSCTATATLCVPPGYTAGTSADCCSNDANVYPGLDDDNSYCLKCDTGTKTQMKGDTAGNNKCEQQCGADSQCDEQATGTCLSQGQCSGACAYLNYDVNSGACSSCGYTYEEDFEAGLTPSCCGDDTGENYKGRVCDTGICTSDSADDACCNSGTDCVYGGTCYSSGTFQDVDSDGLKEYCSSGTWTTAPDDTAGCTYGTECTSGLCICAGQQDCSTAYCRTAGSCNTATYGNNNYPCSNDTVPVSSGGSYVKMCWDPDADGTRTCEPTIVTQKLYLEDEGQIVGSSSTESSALSALLDFSDTITVYAEMKTVTGSVTSNKRFYGRCNITTSSSTGQTNFDRDAGVDTTATTTTPGNYTATFQCSAAANCYNAWPNKLCRTSGGSLENTALSSPWPGHDLQGSSSWDMDIYYAFDEVQGSCSVTCTSDTLNVTFSPSHRNPDYSSESFTLKGCYGDSNCEAASANTCTTSGTGWGSCAISTTVTEGTAVYAYGKVANYPWIDTDAALSCGSIPDLDTSSCWCNAGGGAWVGGACCGDDGSSDTYQADTNTICYQGRVLLCNSASIGVEDANYTTGAKVGSYYCASSGWTTTLPASLNDSYPRFCEDAGGTWLGGPGSEGCCESGEQFVLDGVPEEGILAEFKFDEGSGNEAKDGKGGYVGMVNGATWSTGTKVEGTALYFDGVDDYVNVESINPTDEITVAAWVRSDRNYYKGLWQMVSKYSAYILGTGTANSNTTCFIVNTGSWVYNACYTVPDPMNWHYFVGTYNSSSGVVRLYVDGVLRGTSSTTPGSKITADTGPLHIGHRECCTEYFSGYIDEVTIWNRSLTDEEIAILYRSYPESVQQDLVGYWALDGNAQDSSGHGNDGVAYGSPSWVSGKSSQAVYLNGTDQYINTTGDLKINSEMTITLWFNKSNLDQGSQYLIDGRNGGNWWLLQDYASGACTDTTGNVCFDGRVEAKSGNFSAGAWNFIAVTANATESRMYVNGEPVSRGSGTTPVAKWVSIGTRYNGWSDFNGVIDEVRIYNRTLSPGEISYIYRLEKWQKYGCDSSKVWCTESDDCSKGLSESGVAYYCYGGRFTDYRSLMDYCSSICTAQGGTWAGGGSYRNCCSESSEYWCNETAGMDSACVGGVIYSCDFWCDTQGSGCTPDADGDCTATTTCASSTQCDCVKTEGTACSSNSECESNNCASVNYDQALSSYEGSWNGTYISGLSGGVCCDAGNCAFDQNRDNSMDACATNTSISVDFDSDTDLDYCDNGTWKECKDWVAENRLASDCSCVGNGIAVNISGGWSCGLEPYTPASCGTPCDSDSDTGTYEMINSSGYCITPNTACSSLLETARWSGNDSLIVAEVLVNCPCGEAASCTLTVEGTSSTKAQKVFSAGSGTTTYASLEPNFDYGSNNVSISCSCSSTSTTCSQVDAVLVSSAGEISTQEVVAGRVDEFNVTVGNYGNIPINVSLNLTGSGTGVWHTNYTSFYLANRTTTVVAFYNTYACSWQNATWVTGQASKAIAYSARVNLSRVGYDYTLSGTGNLVQCETAADCTGCCGTGEWWCWLNSSQSSDFVCSSGVCCPAGEKFENGACCISSERCCLTDSSCDTGEWCDNYTSGAPTDASYICKAKKQLGESCTQGRECDSGYCGNGICADSNPVLLSEWYECAQGVGSYCAYQSVSGTNNFDPQGCNADGDCSAGYYCYEPRRACIACPSSSTVYQGVNISDDGLCPSTSCIGYDLDCCTSDSDCESGEWCDSGASCTACSDRSDGVCASSSCVGIDPDCCSTDSDCASGLYCVGGTCTGNLGEGCSSDSDCTGGLKCLGGTCSKSSFIALSPYKAVYDATLGDTLRLTLIVNDPQNKYDRYTVYVDQSTVPDSAFVSVDGVKSEEFEMGAGDAKKFVVTVYAGRLTSQSPDIYNRIYVKSKSNPFISDNVTLKVDITQSSSSRVPAAPMDAWLWVLLIGYLLGVVLEGKNL